PPGQLLKPLMEKRRRDRMNRSLDRLRLLLLAATRDEVRLYRDYRASIKAEILQKTVQFLRAQPLSEPSGTEELFLRRYRSGYRECLARAAHFLQAIPAEPPCPGLGPTAVCPPPLAAGPADTAGPPGRHGLPVPQVGPGCPGYHGYGPGYHNFGPTPGPSLGPTH
ncbi:Transcription factor HES-7.1-A, partial [Eudyptes schlegeli]